MPPGTIRTTCPYCGVGCGLTATAGAGAPAIAGDPLHPANRGALCSKGAALGETLGMPGRLRFPMVHGRRAEWGQALDFVARRFADTVERFGPDSVAFYVSGQLLTEDYYVANKLMKGFIGSANIDTNSRLCMASSVAGHRRAFGEDVVPGCYDDIEQADLVVLVGSNLAWCHPVLHQRLLKARAERGLGIVVIDPRRTASCSEADLHLAIRPGTDVALFNGLLAEIERRGAVDREYVGAHTEGFAEAATAALATAPALADVAEICDVPMHRLAIFYDGFIATERVVTIFSQGVNQSSAGTDKVNAIINCHLATGRIGKPGMGPFSVTGQPNAMGGREVGGLANQLAAHMTFDNAEDIERVGRFWGSPRVASHTGLTAVDMFRAVEDGRVRAIWIMGTNPAVSMPDAAAVRRALAACPFVAISDCEAETDTMRFAHVVLPAAAWGEKDGTVTNSERMISRQRPFMDAPGEARPDWWIVSEVARRMGFAEEFPYRSPVEIFREHAALSAFENDGRRVFDIGAVANIPEPEYAELEPFQWPLPARATSGPARLFADGRFAMPDGRARFVATQYRAPAHAASEAFPLILNTGRLRDQWHTMTRTGKSPRLAGHSPEPTVVLHPLDAARLSVRDGGLARVVTDRGHALVRAQLSDEVRYGEVFVSMHWTDANASSAVIGRLVNPDTDPISFQPELKHTPVRVEAVTPRWRGYLLSRTFRVPDGAFYWARVAVPGGTMTELAGDHVANDAGAWARALMAVEDGDGILEFADVGRGVQRWARLVDGCLEACLFVTQDSGVDHLPPRDWLTELLGASAVDSDTRSALLIGRRAGGSADAGRIVCSCFAVGMTALLSVLASGEAASVEDVGRLLQAGTNCGSCVSELRELVDSHLPQAVSGTAA
jgi:assimilatory nitrate reductase catalytic subunit